MDYQTFPVNECLSSFVECFWTLKGSESIGKEQVIVPDGKMEMIFHFGDHYRQHLPDGTSIIQPKCFVIGQLTEPLRIEPTGATDIFAARFHPQGFAPFTKLPLQQYENSALSLDKVFGQGGSKLEKQILKITNTEKCIDIIESFLLDKVTNRYDTENLLQSTIELILKVKGKYTVEELSQMTQVNRRQIERRFRKTVGVSPKYLSRIIRLQTILKELLNKNYPNLTSLAHGEGYYDQAHFIKDFKAFTGQTPKQFYGDSLMMSSLFYGKK